MYETVVVSPDWVESRRDEIRLVDVRDAWEFDGIGHVPGAVNIPFDEFRSADGDEGMLPGGDVWESLLSAAGIGPDDHLVAYDDTHGVFAARFLVTAELYGHPTERLHLLDGDYSAWNRDRETTSAATDATETTYEIRDPEHSPLVEYEFVLDSLDDKAAVVVDTREAWEFEEGHLPGAVNLDWRELVDEETRGLKPADELEAILDDVGITPDRRVVLYCNTARRISHTYVVLRSLGYENIAFYEGSLTEWEERGGPIETGE
ncbi:sulfurtransferase [Halogeometricum borinquense]|uniref:Sulfurtransferase n=1 Tax=Halogeometricum borinquense TaxID=60847 RepID=A0A6C0UMB5_9EURY|nr:sulfurtransferase [Halogeometricum borinquense]QIB76330.1 sulfurtransferase [Halogeometricum borinquense]QIQ75234.1 sulfurtransferase [Halogeometricum borinquense]